MADENDWRSALPEEIKKDPSVAKFKDVGELARSYVEAQGLIGRSIRPPGPDAAPEVKREFVTKLLTIDPALIYAPDGDEEAVNRMWTKLGKPGKPEEYEIPAIAKDAGLDENHLRSIAVTGGLTKKQFAGLVEVMAKGTLETKRQAALERLALEQEWGEAKEERTLAAQAAAMKMGLTEPEVKALSPRQLKAFASVAKAIGVKTNEFREHGSPGPAMDRAEARARQAEIRAHPDFFDAYSNPSKHAALVAEMSKLSQAAYGD